MTPGASHDPRTAVVVRCISPVRLDEYRTYCKGDVAAALDLYRWNTEITGALWETIGHVEVALRNTLADRLAYRHQQRSRPGSWLDNPARELDQKAVTDIAKARDRVRRNGKAVTDGQVISELAFGFWRFLLARRYTNLWPGLVVGFPHAPSRDRRAVEQPVIRLHELRNRLAHHQRVWTEPLTARWADMRDVLGYIDPHLRDWATAHSRVPTVLASCPVTRPHP